MQKTKKRIEKKSKHPTADNKRYYQSVAYDPKDMPSGTRVWRGHCTCEICYNCRAKPVGVDAICYECWWLTRSEFRSALEYILNDMSEEDVDY